MISRSFADLVSSTGVANATPGNLVMILVGCVLLYLAIVKKFEPLLLLPIGIGAILTNIPVSGIFHSEIWLGPAGLGPGEWGKSDIFQALVELGGLVDWLYMGVKFGIFPPLIFMGVGAMTDFGPLLANPKTILLGAAAQFGIFATLLGALGLGFNLQEASAIGIIGGADGPTAIFLTSKLADHLMGPIAVSAYSYMALVPIIQPPIMRLVVPEDQRRIRMEQLKEVSKRVKIIFPIAVTVFVGFLLPTATPLIGALMLGNLFRESGVVDRLLGAAQNELLNIVTIFLGVGVGATMTAQNFLNWQTISILLLGLVAFMVGTTAGLLLARLMNLIAREPVNPLIGSAGVSAVPMAARVSQVVGQEADPDNYLLMHAMGPNVAGVIGSAVAAGILLAIVGCEGETDGSARISGQGAIQECWAVYTSWACGRDSGRSRRGGRCAGRPGGSEGSGACGRPRQGRRSEGGEGSRCDTLGCGRDAGDGYQGPYRLQGSDRGGFGYCCLLYTSDAADE